MRIQFLEVAKRCGLMAGFTVFYLFFVRPMRAIYSEYVVYEGLLSSQSSIGNIISAFHSARQVLITYMSNGNEMVMSHIPQFGFFFLCGMVGLIFFKAGRNAYLGLVVFQLVVEIFVLIFFTVGIHYTTGGFVLSDFLMTYLSPLGCLGFVVFVSMSKNKFGNSSI